MAENYQKLSITVNPVIKRLSDEVLTPPGFLEPSKGSYSKLINILLQQYVEKFYDSDILTIMEKSELVGTGKVELKEALTSGS